MIPGAPAPAPSKSQKKKRKAGKKEGEDVSTPATTTVEIPDAQSSAFTDKAPGPEDVKGGAVADELLAHGKEPSVEQKLSPVAELLNKRIKALGKKIVSIVKA